MHNHLHTSPHLLFMRHPILPEETTHAHVYEPSERLVGRR